MPTRRIHITGASGSGTTTLGKALAVAIQARHFDTDSYYWDTFGPPLQMKRDVPQRLALLKEAIQEPFWVLSGSLDG